MTTDSTQLIDKGIDEMGLSLPVGTAERLARFLALLAKWNRAQNLTAITDPPAMVAGHVLDSFAGLPWITGERVLDAGSGAGLPGIPLAVADPGRQYVLLDSRNRRVQFLLYAKQALGLHNVSVVGARLEKYRPAGKFGTLTARALAPFPELVRLATPFINADARLVVWRGGDPSVALESALADRRFCYAAHPVRVPGIRAPRHIVVVETAERGAVGPPSRPG